MRIEEITSSLPAGHRERIEACLDLQYRQAVHSAKLQGSVETLLKADSSPVTVIDLLHQLQLQEILAGRFPGDGLICEEPRSLQEQVLEEALEISTATYGIELGGDIPHLADHGEVVWILDPIDGTKGFLAGRCFAIAAGYFEGARPYFGALAVPGGDGSAPRAIDATLSFAVRGRGAWTTGVDIDRDPDWRPLRAPAWNGGRLGVAVSLAHGGPLVDRLAEVTGLEVVKLDSQAKYAAVAMGDIDAYLRARRDDGHPDVVWDHMPGALVAAESGAAVSHFDGGRVEFEVEVAVGFRGGVICCAPSAGEELHRKLMELALGY